VRVIIVVVYPIMLVQPMIGLRVALASCTRLEPCSDKITVVQCNYLNWLLLCYSNVVLLGDPFKMVEGKFTSGFENMTLIGWYFSLFP